MVDFLLIYWFIIAFAMSGALAVKCPRFSGWDNVSRSIAWPITLYEITLNMI